jgi:transcriptional regulator with XRE-family HTH domain
MCELLSIQIIHLNAFFVVEWTNIKKMDGIIFWEMVKQEIQQQNTSFEWLYAETGISKGTFSSWKNRNTFPRADEAYTIANALGVTVEYLLTGTNKSVYLSKPTIQEIVHIIRLFDQYDLNAVHELAKTMSQRYTRH